MPGGLEVVLRGLVFFNQLSFVVNDIGHFVVIPDGRTDGEKGVEEGLVKGEVAVGDGFDLVVALVDEVIGRVHVGEDRLFFLELLIVEEQLFYVVGEGLGARGGGEGEDHGEGCDELAGHICRDLGDKYGVWEGGFL